MYKHSPSYIRNNTQLMKLLETLPSFFYNANLVSANILSLNTNIPHEQGTVSVVHYIKTQDFVSIYTPSSYTIGKLLETLLKKAIIPCPSSTTSLHQKTIFAKLFDILRTKGISLWRKLSMVSHKEITCKRIIWAIYFWGRIKDDIFLIFSCTTNFQS